MKTYLVGGAVRDKLLKIPVKDRDWVVVGATVEDMLAAKFQQIGKDFPVFLHPKTKEEYALARTERKSGKGYTGFEVHASPDVSLEEDLLRRDLSINAIAEDSQGHLIDPLQGENDLNNKILRHVSPAFSEDPLRVLRVARFAARFAHLGFVIAPETLKLMQKMTKKGELKDLISERIWQEIQKALQTQSPQVFFMVLQRCHALNEISSELSTLLAAPQQVATALQALKKAATLTQNPAVRFAALCNSGNNDASLTEQQIATLCRNLKAPKDYADLAKLVQRHSIAYHTALKLNVEQILETIEQLDAYRRPDRFKLFLQVCAANVPEDSQSESAAKETLLTRALAITKQVNTKDIIAAGYSGQDIGIQLRIERLAALSSTL